MRNVDAEIGAQRIRISPRLRFEVFKRDGFTCRYCGRKTPEVVLQVDHVIPVAEDGDNNIENLVAACWECNSGKSDKLLSDSAPVTDIQEQSILILERELQLREYSTVKRAQREREDEDIDELLDFWQSLAHGRFTQKKIDIHVLRGWLRTLSCEDIKDYMEIAMSKAQTYGQFQYLCGIIRNIRSKY